MDRVAVFGIGSTNLRSSVATPDGTFVHGKASERTQARSLADQVVAAVDRLDEEAGPIDAVAVSIAGLVDKSAGSVRKFDTREGETVDRIDLAAAVDRAHGLDLYLENDCSASALAEWYYGARENHQSVAHVTFGTGIGAGVVERGRLIRGEHAQACEVGLLPLVPDGDRSSTGITGAWEAYCSGRGIAGFVRDRYDDRNPDTTLDRDAITASAVFEAASEGDAFARDCLARVDRLNAAGMGALCNAFDPGLVTLGGGVALNNPDRVLSGIQSSLEEFCFVTEPEFRISPLADDIGLYGALGTYLDGTEEQVRSVAGDD